MDISHGMVEVEEEDILWKWGACPLTAAMGIPV
jgi:hypothetical protein